MAYSRIPNLRWSLSLFWKTHLIWLLPGRGKWREISAARTIIAANPNNMYSSVVHISRNKCVSWHISNKNTKHKRRVLNIAHISLATNRKSSLQNACKYSESEWRMPFNGLVSFWDFKLFVKEKIYLWNICIWSQSIDKVRIETNHLVIG